MCSPVRLASACSSLLLRQRRMHVPHAAQCDPPGMLLRRLLLSPTPRQWPTWWPSGLVPTFNASPQTMLRPYKQCIPTKNAAPLQTMHPCKQCCAPTNNAAPLQTMHPYKQCCAPKNNASLQTMLRPGLQVVHVRRYSARALWLALWPWLFWPVSALVHHSFPHPSVCHAGRGCPRPWPRPPCTTTTSAHGASSPHHLLTSWCVRAPSCARVCRASAARLP